MKVNAVLSIIMAGALALSAVSCSTSRGKTTSNKDKFQTTIVKKTNKDKNKNRPVTETDVPESPQGERPSDEVLGGGRWLVDMVGDIKVPTSDEMPYIEFQPSTGRFYASDGCNIVNGDYVLRSNGDMLFSNVLSTMKYCPDMDYSAMLADALSGRQQFTVGAKQIGQDTYLSLLNKSGKSVLTLRRHNMEFLNGSWLVTSIGGKEINDEECNIFIDIAELKVHGNTGCNYFNGTLYINPEATNAIDFSNMGLTRMACYKGDQESAMMLALEETTTAIAGKDDDTVLLLNSKGKQLMTLKRMELPQSDE